MEHSPEPSRYCPICGAPRIEGAFDCERCGIPFAPIPSSQIIYLPLPVSKGPTWISWSLLAVNILVWLVITAAGGSTDLDVLLRFGAKYGPAILDGEYWRFFSSMFLHIGLAHLGFNGYALYALGPEVESLFGRSRFLVTYLFSGVFGGVISYLFDSTLAAGASGAIFGLVGALTAFYIRGRKILGSVGRRRLSNLATVVVINLILGFSMSNIDNWAHMGGLAAGFLIGWVLSPDYEVVPAGPGGPARVEDHNSLIRRWWLIPMALLFAIGLTLMGNLREGNTASGYLLRGESYMEQGDWGSAIDAFTEAIEREPRLWTAFIYRGEVFLQVDDYDAALDDFEAVIEGGRDPQRLSIAYSGRGRVFLLRGDSSRALADLDRAVSLDPLEPFARYVRGLILYDSGDANQAVEDLQAALDLGLQDERSVAITRQVLEILSSEELSD